ncbi:MAG: lactococcin 972 family bacteriocin [Turicibacter sp.]|nr:lactococcin 972 family bacteriocin [Turicibacter sp.]
MYTKLQRNLKNAAPKVLLAGGILVAGGSLSSTTVNAMPQIFSVELGGSIVVEEGAETASKEIQVNLPGLSRNIYHGDLRGTFSSGNQNTNWLGRGGQVWSSVTGNASGAGRARGRATVRNGNGQERTGGFQNPGVNSRAEIDRTSGTNQAFWGLAAPLN